MMINQALARRDFPNEDPVGKRINLGNTDSNGQPVWFEIVGVAANVRSLELREEPLPDFYLSSLQDTFNGMSIVIRSAVEPGSLISVVRNAVQDTDRSQPVSDIKTMDHIVSEAVTQPRFTLFLFGIFGGIALLLSAAGVYGVTAYTVTQRTHEIGIRVALGAGAGDVLKLIAGQGLKAICGGIVIGLVASFALTRLLPQLMKNLLFGVSATDPLTFVLIAVLLTIVAMFACWLPARRATKVDPMVALRYE
jgi:putative ABC transport system permease protein